jgi:hypothetical protein
MRLSGVGICGINVPVKNAQLMEQIWKFQLLRILLEKGRRSIWFRERHPEILNQHHSWLRNTVGIPQEIHQFKVIQKAHRLRLTKTLDSCVEVGANFSWRILFERFKDIDLDWSNFIFIVISCSTYFCFSFRINVSLSKWSNAPFHTSGEYPFLFF